MYMNNYLDAAIEIAREAGQVLLSHRGVGFELKGAYDLVTAADRASEQLIVERLKQRFPQHGIVAEEGGRAEMNAELRWYVDPLDGTTNFAHGLPFFCVSIALEDAHGPLAGVVEAPALGWQFYAARGQGAFLVERGMAERRLAVSDTDELRASLLATGFPYDTASSARNNLAEWARIYPETQGLRRVGAAALDLCFVAAGWMDGYWELKIKPWDVAAGALFVVEAGGRVSDYRGGAFTSDGGEILATNGRLHDALAAALAQT